MGAGETEGLAYLGLDVSRSGMEVSHAIGMLQATVDEELATMQQLLNEAHDEAANSRRDYEHRLAKFKAIVGQLENENHELKIQLKLEPPQA